MQNIYHAQTTKFSEGNEHELRAWKAVKLGTGLKTADDFRKALKTSGNRIGDWGNDLLGKPAFTVASEETEVELLQVTNVELGFKDGAYLKDSFKRALELGLELCPNEAGPQLRLQWQNQPKGEWLLAMEPITNSDGGLSLFSIVHDDDGLWLDGSPGHPDRFWIGHRRFVFARKTCLCRQDGSP